MPPFCLGLTGSIGMGKSTTTDFFKKAGIPVWDSDEIVHQLYAPGGELSATFKEKIPEAIDESGGVSREKLRNLISHKPELLEQVNNIVHPVIIEHRKSFINKAQSDIVLLDIPLLFEIGAHKMCNAVVVVSAPFEIQRERVLSRPEMTPKLFDLILSRQVPDQEKRRRADYIIETTSFDDAQRAVEGIIKKIRKEIMELSNKP